MKIVNNFILFLLFTILTACKSPLTDKESPNDPKPAITKFHAPVINSVEIIDHHSVRLKWNDSDADFYAIFCGDNPKNIPHQPILWDIERPEVIINALTDNASYYFWIIGYSGDSWSGRNKISDFSEVIPVLTQLCPPLLRIDENKTTASSFHLSWEVVGGATSYEIVYFKYPESESVNEESWHKKTTNNTQIVIDGLEYDTLYVFRSRAHSLTGNKSNFSGQTWPYRTRINPPSEIWVDEVTPTSIKLRWADMDSSGYVLRYGSDQSLIYYTFNLGAKTCEFILNSLQENSPYYFSISARDLSGLESEEKHFTYYTLFSKIENLTAQTVSESEVALSWDRKYGADAYIVEVYDHNLSLLRKTPLGNMIRNMEYMVTNLSPNTLLFFVVRAVNEAAIGANAAHHVEGEPGDRASARTLLPAPEKPVITRSLSRSIELSWQQVAEADFYRVYYNTENSFETYTEYTPEQQIITTNCSVTDLERDRRYYFYIQAFDNMQNYSRPSPAAEGRTIISNISIVFEGFAYPEDPLLEELPENLIQVSMETYIVTVKPDGWDETYNWFLNGVEDKSENGNSYNINLQQLTVGSYLLTVVATKNGVPYSGSIRFKVQ